MVLYGTSKNLIKIQKDFKSILFQKKKGTQELYFREQVTHFAQFGTICTI